MGRSRLHGLVTWLSRYAAALHAVAVDTLSWGGVFVKDGYASETGD